MHIVPIVLAATLCLSAPTGGSTDWNFNQYRAPLKNCIYQLNAQSAEHKRLMEALERKNIKVENARKFKNNVELLARLIHAEAGICSDECKYYVGSVVLNRITSDKFPNSLKEVIYQDGQYQCVTNTSIDNTPSDDELEIAEDLLVFGSVLPEDVVFQSEFEQGSRVYTVIDGEYFCYE